ncbi:MAG: tRNA lysidine(34) synthetase TilS [Sphaerobacteraceae bacterium]|nr:MAG: tRNA lysidine(34) synthetase TilS [Sphaerobacteraceae bacterium]
MVGFGLIADRYNTQAGKQVWAFPMSSALRTIEDHVRASLASISHPSDRALIIGLSGGRDSQVLAHSLLQIAANDGPPLLAVHVDHGMRPESGDDARRVQALCEAWDLPCTLVEVDISQWDAALNQGAESAARHARYAALARAALNHDSDIIATAHHLDDQIETVLLRMISGSGLEGMSGMAPLTRRLIPLDPGRPPLRRLKVFRPLLGLARADLETYAREAGIDPIHDPTNDSNAYRRNAIRQTVVPAMEAIEPAVRESTARTCELLQDDADFISAAVDSAFNDIVANRAGVWTVERKLFRESHPSIQRRVLFRIIDGVLGSRARLRYERLEALRNAALDGQPGKVIELADGLVGYVDYDRLAIGFTDTLEDDLRRLAWVPLLEPGTELELSGDVDIPLTNGWRIRGHVESDETMLLRTRHDGDRTRVRGREIKLQDWLVNQKVPRYLRDWLPVVATAEDVRWVIGLDIMAYPEGRGGVQLHLELDMNGSTVRE